MKKRVEKTLDTESLISKKDLILVGVSGGPDSMGLLHLLNTLGYRLAVGHLNHGLRPEAEHDADIVRSHSEKLGLEFYIKDVDTNQYAQEQGMSIEEAGRALRYQFLSETAEKIGAAALAVGHTADDQVETVLMHLLRGSGLGGLRGMQVRSVNPYNPELVSVVRPLLGIWREDVLAYCKKHDLKPIFDQSNQDTTFYRNQLRHELIPTLTEYNPKIKNVVWRMAETLRADYDILNIVIQEAWKNCILHEGKNAIAIDVDFFLTQPLGVQRGLARMVIAHHRPTLRDIDFAAVERFLAFAAYPTKTNKMDLIAGLDLLYEEGEIWIVEQGCDLPLGDWPQLEQDEVLFSVPGEVELQNGWCIQAELVSMNSDIYQKILNNQSDEIVWLAADTNELVLRRKEEGDRFQPFGMEGHSIKLSDFFINIKLLKRARTAWPLVFIKDQIAWVVGKRIGEPFRVGEATASVVKIQLVKAKTK